MSSATPRRQGRRLSGVVRVPAGRTRSLAALAAAAAAALVGVLLAATRPAAAAGETAAGTVRTELLRVTGVPEPDGTPVTLDAAVYLPAGAGRAPAVLLAHGFGGSRDDLDAEARRLAGQGYVALAWTARGFGRSGGSVHLDAPGFEVADARRLVDLLAQRPEVLLDGPADPRVGVAGASYGGALALLLAGTDPRIDAIAPRITWNDLRQSLFPQFAVSGAPSDARSPADVVPTGGAGVFKKAWASVFFSAAGAGLVRPGAPSPAVDRPAVDRESGAAVDSVCGRFSPELCRAYQTTAETGRPTPAILDLLAASSPARVLHRITAPTLLVQGQADSLFPLSEAEANARGIAATGTPVKVVWYGGGHDGGADESARLQALTDAWFSRYLRQDGSAPDTRFEVTVPAATLGGAQGRSAAAPEVRVADGVPGITRGTATSTTVRLSGDAQTAVAPAGGAPAAITAVPGLGGVLGGLGAGDLLGTSALPGQVAVFESGPLAGGVQLVGAPRVRLRVTTPAPDATLFAQLHVVTPDGRASLPQRLVSPVHLPAPAPRGADVTVSLPATVRDVPAGSRLRLVISTTDQGYAMPLQARRYAIELADRTLTLPVVPTAPVATAGLGRFLPWALGLLAVAVLLVVGGWVVGRRRLASGVEAGPGELPVRVEGLGKAYGDGYRAVSDLTFEVRPGWVLGLLGPNGAGKTTTLRMLLGLIRPTEGRIVVFGHEVRPGAPVLSRVGAFVEGPGFLPHASGLENLTLAWRATGRPMHEAHLEEALEVAGLKDDVHRRVRTYSQGMRQRLAIAQAMLGLPDLLVLDEPTNGLDPPQIREMRAVLRRYAATGRTVVVSSHLLSEVEQTCDHVVVMHRGRLVAAGEVGELVGTATSLVVDVDDPQRAVQVAQGLPGARDVVRTPTGMTLTLAGTPRAELVRALVAARVDVDRITPRHGLEEAFLALVEES